jgi:hydrogenase maturation protease
VSVLIGIGNPFRRDDGVGPAVAAEFDRLGVPGVTVACADGEPSQLLDAWDGAELAVVVDAVVCSPADPGRVHRAELGQPYVLDGQALLAAPPGAGSSTHGLGVPDAIRLAVALDRAPARLVVYAVEAADLGFGTGLSGPVAASLPELTRMVRAELAVGQRG